MDWTALRVSLWLGLGTVAILLPVGVWIGRLLAVRDFRGKLLVEALVTVPLVLPPTVLGFYLLVTFGARSPLGQAFQRVMGQSLPFSFEGLLLASAIANIPFVIQPIQRGFEAISSDIRDAAACCGLTPWQRLTQIEIPLAWPSILTAAILTFAHTLGEFGVVLMVGGSTSGTVTSASTSSLPRNCRYARTRPNQIPNGIRTMIVPVPSHSETRRADQSMRRYCGTAYPCFRKIDRAASLRTYW